MADYSIYPKAIDGFAQMPLAVDRRSPINAESVNRLRSGIINIQDTLGVAPHVSSRYGEFPHVDERLENLEGLMEGALEAPEYEAFDPTGIELRIDTIELMLEGYVSYDDYEPFDSSPMEVRLSSLEAGLSSVETDVAAVSLDSAYRVGRSITADLGPIEISEDNIVFLGPSGQTASIGIPSSSFEVSSENTISIMTSPATTEPSGSIVVATGHSSSAESSGAVLIASGPNLSGGISGDVTIQTGDSNAAGPTVASGNISILTGSALDSVGIIDIRPGIAEGADGAMTAIAGGDATLEGGQLWMTGGQSLTTGRGGDVIIAGGNSSDTAGGDVRLAGGTGASPLENGTIHLQASTKIYRGLTLPIIRFIDPNGADPALADTYVLNENHYTVLISGGDHTKVQLPDSTTCEGTVYIIKRINPPVGAPTLIVDPASSDNIDGFASKTLSTQWSTYTVQSDGVGNWWILSET